MNGIELKLNRELIGLSAGWCARRLGVAERSWAAVEASDSDVPERYEDLILQFLDDSYAHVNALLVAANNQAVTAYDKEQDLWQAFPAVEGMPITWHRSAVIRGLEMLRLQKRRQFSVVRYRREGPPMQAQRGKPDPMASVHAALPDIPDEPL